MRDEIIEMAKEAGFDDYVYEAKNLFERFYDLAVQRERERIKEENAPEIERCNAYIKALHALNQELLEALKKISRTEYYIETPPIESLEEKMRRIARAAIAKAEGEKQ